jgi:polysaccharide biosynthesis PFTS motif protein
LSSGRINKFGDANIDIHDLYALHTSIIETIDGIFNDKFRWNSLIKLMESFFNSPYIYDAYKKTYALKIYDLYRTYFLVSAIGHFYQNSDKIIFFPRSTVEYVNESPKKGDFLHSSQTVTIPPSARFLTFCSDGFDKIKWLAIILGFPFWIILQIQFPKLNEEKMKVYQTGIRIYSTDWGFYQKYRKIDFLLDGEQLNANNTIFCVETDISDDYRDKLREKKYTTIEIRKILKNLNIKLLNKIIIKKTAPAWFLSFIKSVFQPPWIIKTTLESVHMFIIWSVFLERFKISHYVVYNDFTPNHIARNILLHEKKVKTWFYIHSCNTPDYYTPRNEKEYQHIYFSYPYYDNFVTWGDKTRDFYSTHPNNIGCYKNLGCLWSEQILRINQNNLVNECLNNASEKISKDEAAGIQKIIGVFDTSFGDQVPLQKNDIIRFVQGMLRLLNDYPRIGIIFKEKNSLDLIMAQEPDIATYYISLRNHPRCYFTGDRFDPSETIAASDLVISSCFTSTTIEALGARKRAIYFDATDKFRDYYYDKFPNLVAHSYENLQEMVNYWLFKISDDDFNKYLNDYVKNELDAYVDGKALSRFREQISI